jgi:myo-inositol-1(or 4)-monophosphatase
LPAPDPAGIDLAADLALLTDAATAAGQIAARHFGTGVATWDKGGGQGPVTAADLEVNAWLHEHLRAARPGYGWLSEEGDALADTARLSAPATFVIDPIDGTRAFIEGQKSFAHALAVVVAGRPVVAVVHLPLLGLTYRASLGQGAWLGDQRLKASPRSALLGARVLAARPMLEPHRWPGGLPPVERHFRPSLAWRLALVGEGRFDAMITLRDTWDWDIAASALIAAEAGAQVTDRAGAPLAFNTLLARSPGVLAGPAPLHAALLTALGHGKDLPPVPPAPAAR